MSVIETIEAIRSGLMWIGLSALAAIAVGVVGAWLYRGVASVMRCSLAVARIVAFVAVSAFCVIRGGAKFLMPPPSTGGTPVAPVVVTPEEITQGWRLESVTTNDEVSYAMPEGVSPSFNWHKRGTFGEWARLDLGDFAFPLGTNSGAVISLSVFNDGRIRPTPRDFAREICAVGVPMLAMQGASRFWVAETTASSIPPHRVKRLTWENFFLNADTNAPVNAQIELFQNGDFTTRSNDVERVYRRVAPFDWDGDGLENTVDPDPLVAGADAHGTNAEWYNVVCSNVLEAVGGDGSAGTPRPTLSWLDGVNTNAYYFVDVVTTNGLAPIYFIGDRDSRLGNPVVVACGGETNHVPLLIGVTYAVTSTVPFSVSLPDDGFASVTTNSVSDYDVRWPLDFVFTERIEESGRVYTVTVEPFDPGGVLTWEVGGMRSGTSPGCGCGCLGCVGYSVAFNCPAICTCHGECKAVGGYAFEKALFAVTGGVCRCGFDDPFESGTGHDTNNVPMLSVSFSRQAVIFEDAYEDSPGVVKPRRSSRVRITVDAYGGEHGGVLSVSAANLGKLTSIGGGVTMPIHYGLASEEHFYVTGVYEGAEASGSTNDVTLSGTFTEYFTSQQHQSNDSLTVVRVELRPHVIAPNNDSLNRHRYGVRELVRYVQEPLAPAVTWNPVGGGVIETVGLHDYYRCPLYGCENPLRAEIGAATYPFSVEVVEPDGMESKAIGAVVYSNVVHRGEAGGIGMELYLYVTPKDVSFSEISVQEVPCFTYTVERYFENPYFNGAFAHTGGSWGAGAGRWLDVDPDGNRLKGQDTAAYEEKIPWLTPSGTPTTNSAYAWTEGHAYMDTPMGWNVKGTSGNTPPYKRFGEGLQQVFRIDRHGRVGVFKLDNEAIRTTNDVVTLMGPRTERLP